MTAKGYVCQVKYLMATGKPLGAVKKLLVDLSSVFPRLSAEQFALSGVLTMARLLSGDARSLYAIRSSDCLA